MTPGPAVGDRPRDGGRSVVFILLGVSGGAMAAIVVEFARRAVLGRRLQESMIRVDALEPRRPI